jgi:hypothetical protein
VSNISVTRLTPPVIEPRPRCSAVLSLQVREFWQHHGRPGNREGADTCGCYASYTIDAKPYCAKHAAIRALNLAVEAGQIEIFP